MTHPTLDIMREVAQQCSVNESSGRLSVAHFMNDRVLICMSDESASPFHVMTQNWREAIHSAASLVVQAELALIVGAGWDAQQAREDVLSLFYQSANELIADIQKQAAP